jgi:GNAT superfamily N-acetyltransferase
MQRLRPSRIVRGTMRARRRRASPLAFGEIRKGLGTVRISSDHLARLSVGTRAFANADTMYIISTEKNRLDYDFVVSALQSTYWAGERSNEVILASLERSICFGAYTTDWAQVGFARVVTDGWTFSWLCDVFVDPEYRGLGIGKQLIESVVSHSEICRTSIALGTKDAHSLYEKYNFVRWEHMRRQTKSPNKAVEVTPTAVTDRAEHDPRQP